jgi:histone arginine demethylase JMJD6
VLFEPGTSKKVATGSHLVKAGEDDEAVNYFVDILPRIRQTYPHARRIEVVQRPGDTLYVPAGWWHAVLNLDDTVAVTQNFVSRSSFDGAWDRTRSGRKGMARAWLAKLEGSDDPELRALAARARLQPPVPRIV